MKWLFFIVLLINLAFFGYNFFSGPQLSQADSEVKQSDHQLLVLLSELEQEKQQAQTAKQEKLKAAQSKQPSSATTTTEVAAASKAEQAASSEPAAKAAGNKKTPKNEQAAANGKAKKTKKEPEEPGKTEPEANIGLCHAIGPVDKERMNEIRAYFENEYQKDISFSIDSSAETTYFKIYIPPIQNKDKIKETLALLDKNHLKDRYVMSVNGRKNAIALGVFKQRSAADRVAKKAGKLGLSTTVEAVSDDPKSQYTLQLNFQQQQQAKAFLKLVKKIKIKSHECADKG